VLLSTCVANICSMIVAHVIFEVERTIPKPLDDPTRQRDVAQIRQDRLRAVGKLPEQMPYERPGYTCPAL
jgi:hypothetical protein